MTRFICWLGGPGVDLIIGSAFVAVLCAACVETVR